ncbi:putative uncharacterized protein [Bacteroides pectinophilus CAG:437]|uniref:Lipoprotein n=1 Tax=Bacteroides pectinophilus CAG:437 TaxID=1263051 RepID=R7B4F1_9FIRM|nr:putative uncharacterized protein [Bacteroides pectinophilus CAG:437]
MKKMIFGIITMCIMMMCGCTNGRSENINYTQTKSETNEELSSEYEIESNEEMAEVVSGYVNENMTLQSDYSLKNNDKKDEEMQAYNKLEEDSVNSNQKSNDVEIVYGNTGKCVLVESEEDVEQIRNSLQSLILEIYTGEQFTGWMYKVVLNDSDRTTYTFSGNICSIRIGENETKYLVNKDNNYENIMSILSKYAISN